MEIRRVSKWLYCYNCSQTFNQLVHPEHMESIQCPSCNLGCVVEVSKPRPQEETKEEIKMPAPQNPPSGLTRQNRAAGAVPRRAASKKETAKKTTPDTKSTKKSKVLFKGGIKRPNPTISRQAHEPNAPPRITRPRPEMLHQHYNQELPPISRPHHRDTHHIHEEVKHVHRQEINMPGVHIVFESNQPGGFCVDLLGGMLGPAFSGLRINDFFSEEDPLHPSQMGIDLDDFGMNFQSNFGGGNIINIVEMMSMNDPVNSGIPPASKEAIKKLPVFKIEQKHCKKNEKGIMEPPSCAICCCNIALGEKGQLLPCGHMFHPNCTKPWLKDHNTCPVCRYELPTDDPDYEEVRRRNVTTRKQNRRAHH